MHTYRFTYLLIQLIFISFSGSSFSQKIDYLDIRDSILIITCGEKNSTTLTESIYNLESLDILRLSKNLHQYYQDLGIRYWLMSGSDKNSLYTDRALDSYQNALLHNPKSTNALYNLSFISLVKHDCDRGKYYLDQYKKHTRKKYLDPQLEKMVMIKCQTD